jgi:hypothetical protein
VANFSQTSDLINSILNEIVLTECMQLNREYFIALLCLVSIAYTGRHAIGCLQAMVYTFEEEHYVHFCAFLY